MSEALRIRSHRGEYSVFFDAAPFETLLGPRRHFLVDSHVAESYPRELAPVLEGGSALLIHADEDAKSLERMPRYVEHLVSRRVRRGDQLVAIGGGVVQDITCFLAATLLRGVEWVFFPTTLLAQADSCIGSKSSINAACAKNILGTFTPPREVRVSMAVLDSLPDTEIRSGIGEIFKVHLIHSLERFRSASRDYEAMLSDRVVLARYVAASLEIKKRFIEEDEFDRGIRNVLNYGHSFGHAIESATHFAIPHGIAVTIGMDLANFVSFRLGELPGSLWEELHSGLRANFAGFERQPVPWNEFRAALGKDKKNTPDKLGLVLPDASGLPRKVNISGDDRFWNACEEYFRNNAG